MGKHSGMASHVRRVLLGLTFLSTAECHIETSPQITLLTSAPAVGDIVLASCGSVKIDGPLDQLAIVTEARTNKAKLNIFTGKAQRSDIRLLGTNQEIQGIKWAMHLRTVQHRRYIRA